MNVHQIKANTLAWKRIRGSELFHRPRTHTGRL